MHMTTIVVDVGRYRHKHEEFYEGELAHTLFSIISTCKYKHFSEIPTFAANFQNTICPSLKY